MSENERKIPVLHWNSTRLNELQHNIMSLIHRMYTRALRIYAFAHYSCFHINLISHLSCFTIFAHAGFSSFQHPHRQSPATNNNNNKIPKYQSLQTISDNTVWIFVAFHWHGKMLQFAYFVFAIRIRRGWVHFSINRN